MYNTSMKKIIFLLTMFSILLYSCNDLNDLKEGSIYGVIVDASTAEPVRGAGISLWYDGGLLLKTVTYDDGHFQFDNLATGDYLVIVEMSGYQKQQVPVIVHNGTARADMQIKGLITNMTVATISVEVTGSKVSVSGKAFGTSSSYTPDEMGFVYGTRPMPIKDQDHTISATETDVEVFNVKFIPEKSGVYYIRAYAINAKGIAYGSDLKFETVGLPAVTTFPVTDVTDKTARLNGRIDFGGDPQYHERGFVYSLSFSYPTLEDPASATMKVVVKGIAEDFSANIADLTTNKKYYVRAYATNETDTAYGDVVSFIAQSYKNYVIVDNLAVQRTDASSGSYWSSAQELCEKSSLEGYSDWRVPTVAELALLYVNKDLIGGFSNSDYWSSTRNSNGYCYYINFATGLQSYVYGSDTNKHVRCVRTKQ